MTSILARAPTLVVDMPPIPSEETLDPRKCHWTSIGKSPSKAMHAICAAEPDITASSPKLNGAILGATDERTKRSRSVRGKRDKQKRRDETELDFS